MRLTDITNKIPKDKVLHFVAGFVLGFFCVVFALIAGFVKEQVDEDEGREFDVYDMIATWIGGVFGQCSSILIINFLM